MVQKLINCISMQIDQIFGGATIYTDHVKQKFQSNSFFVRVIKNSEKPLLSNRFKLFNKVEIMYTPEREIEKTEELNQIKSVLFENMQSVKFDQGYIKGENMECEVKDGNLMFYVDYNFYIVRFTKAEKMQRLFSKGGTNERKKY